MATVATIPVSEYLETAFEHDAEFVDGRVEVRPVGELDHGKLQRKLLLLLSAPEYEHLFLCIPELRVQVSPTRYRVPDLCVLSAQAPEEQIITTPPLLCIEILSPEDTMRNTLMRVRDLLAMGVEAVWVFDPESRTVQVCAGNSREERACGFLKVPLTNLELNVDDVFSALRKR